MSTVDLINLIASLASLILSLIAIWITLHFKSEADKVNKESRDLLIDVRTDAKALTSVAETMMGELREYGKASREVTTKLASGQIAQMTISSVSTASEGPPETVQPAAPSKPGSPKI